MPWYLFALNAVLGVAFAGAGVVKLVRPLPALVAMGLTWVEGAPAPAVRLIGVAEVLGAVGLVAPLVTGIAPVLAPVAAVALAVLMIGAVGVHLVRRESPAPPLALGVVALVSAVLGAVVVLG